MRHWRRLTVLGALSGEGMVAAMSIEAATTTRVFLAFLRAVLIPELRRRHPNATVLMDNLPAHKPKAVETVLTRRGSSSSICRAIRPISRRSNPAGPRRRVPCGPPRRARPKRSKPLSRPPSTASPPPTLAAGSTIAVTRFQTNVKTAQHALRAGGRDRRPRRHRRQRRSSRSMKPAPSGPLPRPAPRASAPVPSC